MANVPEGVAQFEYHKMQLIGSLNNVAEQMRACAAVADQFAQLVSHVPYGVPVGQYPHVAVAQATPRVPGRKRKAPADDGEGNKRTRAVKDPNAPKRPASSYLIFQNEVRKELKEKHPSISNNELLTMIAKLWSELPKEKKEAYELRQKTAKDQWLAEKAAYDTQGSPDSPITAPVAPPVVKPVAKPPSKAVPTPVATSEDDSSEAEGSESDESEEEERSVSPPKKSKKESAPAPKEKAPTKEKKSKASKA